MSDAAIAIVGASCRFPGAADLETFWQLLESGRDAVSEVDEERWSTRFYYHPSRGQPGKSYTWAAGLIGDVDRFEPSFFGISPREAVQMDPQQRLLLELVWHAIEDAGIPAAKLAGRTIGVYVGGASRDYSDVRLGDPSGGDSYFMTGNTLSILANRISYVFDLRGPSLTIDTACSSSLVALHHACEAIRSGRIESAIVGGINLLLAPYPFLGFCHAAMLSRRGRCFAFDERADGYVRAEGGAAIVLKPLAAALAAGDPIRAVILGTGINSDGRTIGLSLPSETAQAALLRAVYGEAGVAADELAFFEMHGTGTPAGDPIEAAAVGHSLGQRRSAPLPIGSVKTNLGHLEPASGMAGLLKAALALAKGLLPPTLHCETPNPNIAFETLNLRLVRAVEPIAATAGRRVAGVNSFGFGGTNAHVVLAAPPSRSEQPAAAGEMPPLLISARSEASLKMLARAWAARLADLPAERMPMALRAAARSRDQHAHRLVVLGEDTAAMARQLTLFLDGAAAPAAIAGAAVREGRLAFVFSGNGAQYPGMAQQAWQASAAFRAAVEEVDRTLRPLLGWSVARLIETGADAATMARADIAQPLLFAVQVGIVEALRGLGVAASAHIGHSVGEIAAAWAAGALGLAEAGRVVVSRSRQQQRTQGTGRMAALALGPEAARELLAELGTRLELAAFNASHAVTVSGPSEDIERLEFEARRRGLVCRALDLDFAFHSEKMDPIRADLVAELAELSCRRPAARLISTVTGAPVEEEILDAHYWWRNIRSPVRFAEGMARLVGEGYRIFVEIGPHPILQSYLNDGLRTAAVQGRMLASLSRKAEGGDPFPAIAAHCHVAGYDLAMAAHFDGAADPHALPLYPWNRERFWFDRTVEALDPVNPPFEHPLLGFRQHGPVPFWINHLDEEVVPWIADHAIEGVPVLPAAAVVEIALAAARARWPEAPVLEVFDLEVRRPLPFDKERMRELQTQLTSEDGDWQLSSRPRLADEPLTLHAVGRLAAAGDTRRILHPPEPTRQGPAIAADALYRLAQRMGLDYGSRFRTISRIAPGASGTAIAYLDPSPIDEPLAPYLLHPALLDGALQGLLGLLADHRHRLQGITFLPWRFGRVRLSAPFGRVPGRAELRLTRIGVRSVSADIALYDEAGAIVAELAECWFRRVELGRRSAIDDRALRSDLVPLPLDREGARAALARIGAALPRLAAGRLQRAAEEEQALLLDALVGAIALASLRQLVGTASVPGAPPDSVGDGPSEPAAEVEHAFAIDDLVAGGRLDPAASGMVECLLRLLERLGAASEVDGVWQLDSNSDLPGVTEVWRLLLADAPDLVVELALAAAAAEALPKILAGLPRQPEAWLSAMVEQLLQTSPASAAGIDLLCTAIAEIAAAWPQGRPLRILELGAGGATRRLLERLTQAGVSFSYLATTADAEQALRLSFVTDAFAGAAARQWSPQDGTAPLAGGADSGAGPSFDMVLAANACARLQLDAAAFAGLRDLLSPGGLFLAVEPEPNALWDLVFGQNPLWWQQGSRGAAVSPLRSGAEWRSELAAAGFDDAGAAPTVAAPWPCALFWGHAPAGIEAVSAMPDPESRIAVIAGSEGFAATLAAGLAERGCRVLLSPEYDPAAAEEADGTPPEIVLFVAGTPAENDAVADGARQLAALARTAARAAERQAALWLVTCDAQQATGAAPETAAVAAALWGLGRVLLNEMPRLSLRLVDFAAATAADERVSRLARELRADSPETEIVWTPAGRHGLRLRWGLPPRWAGQADALRLTSSHSGGLASLAWEAGPPRPLGPGEVEIEVAAAGLNFRDMMWAMGLLPEEALIDGFAGATFGLECAGTVRSIGPGVPTDLGGLAVGDRVMALAPASLATRVVTVADAVVPIPPQTSFAAAATIPVTFVTAFYALGHLARLMPGEYVLIHSAAGGVGLSAIQYAKHRGAIVIATAGSEVKRAFVRLAGADHVLNSRDLAFADAVREITGGRGVDVVLNALSGEAMEQSLAVLKPFGRFLELGKNDFYLNRRIHLRPLRQNVSYFAIDVDQLPIHRPDLARALLSEVSEALAAGAIRPLAHRSFSFAEIDEAFRLMQSSGHIGKLVLVPAANAAVRLREPPELPVRSDGTYLVTGGTAGFGFETARWLAARGARSIALLSRRGGDTPGCAERIAELDAAGATVRVYRTDVADSTALAATLAAIRAAGPPLRGVVHAAAMIEDGFAADIDTVRAEPVLRAKLGGALALDALTREDPLDLFLLFSSATTVLGAPGQGVYVAANLAVEALARRRRMEGKPALAVAWGPIEDAGYLAERPDTREALARRLGAKPIPAAQALAGLPALVASGLPVAAFAETSWTEARRFLPILATSPFAEIRSKAASSPSDESLADRLAMLPPEEALALLKTVVAEEAATILRLPPGAIDPQRPLSEIGMDSLMAVELRLALESRLRVDLPLVSLAEGTSVASIAARLAAAVSAGPKEGEIIALAARYEVAGELPPGLDDMAAAKSVAAE
jgi:phthiocerol/phenolphthiocerol synthesis type-I polyketide synthase C